MKTQKTSMFLALMVIAIVSLTMMVTAYRGNFEEESPYHADDRCDEMTQIFDKENFNEWQQIMSEKNSKVVQVIDTEEKFQKFLEARAAGLEGNYELANQLRAELGLNNGAGPKNGEGHGKMRGQGEMKQKSQGQTTTGMRLQQHK